ncbi:MAG: ribonuclease R, partial [Clostridia bacterium]|nr:ribonuclease R [Clostridia bacterium]
DQHFSTDIFVQPKCHLGAKNGQKVVVKINSYPKDNRNCPEGEIIQILGYPNENNVDLMSVAIAYGVQIDFPENVQKRATKIPQTLNEKDYEGRKDLRNQTIFTIDGEDAKDLDDAVSITQNNNGTFTLGVHIADVSHYVQPSDDIDKEAFNRATSVYFPHMVFPMLPRELSNGICSLYQGVDRLTLTCQMTINQKGNVVDYDIYPSVINSCRRLTYNQVQALFDGDKQAQTELEKVSDSLLAMRTLAQILQNKRLKRGNIDFATKEVSFVCNDKGDVVDVVPYERKFSHQLIEEFMIVANETVAEYVENCTYPFVYRVHEKPDEQKLAVLMDLMSGVGIKVKHSQEIHNSVLQDALLQAKQTPYFALINDVMLRTMQKAKYSTNNIGHFGLASRCYCHFTSPIRRYPDLIVHRILKTAVAGKMTEKAITAYETMTEECATQSSRQERNADEAERKADDVLKCKYASKHIGESYDAIISGVTERGIFAELPNTVEGFISIDKLPGYFSYNAQKFCLTNGSIKYSLGDSVKIVIQSVNKLAYKIDFDLYSQPQEPTEQ